MLSSVLHTANAAPRRQGFVTTAAWVHARTGRSGARQTRPGRLAPQSWLDPVTGPPAPGAAG
jgi:hypothetical protein